MVEYTVEGTNLLIRDHVRNDEEESRRIVENALIRFMMEEERIRTGARLMVDHKKSIQAYNQCMTQCRELYMELFTGVDVYLRYAWCHPEDKSGEMPPKKIFQCDFFGEELWTLIEEKSCRKKCLRKELIHTIVVSVIITVVYCVATILLLML